MEGEGLSLAESIRPPEAAETAWNKVPQGCLKGQNKIPWERSTSCGAEAEVAWGRGRRVFTGGWGHC